MVDMSGFIWRETDLPHRNGKRTSKSRRNALKTERAVYFTILFVCFFPASLVTWAVSKALGRHVQVNPLRSALSKAEEISAVIFM